MTELLEVSLFRGNDGKMRSSVVRTGQSDNSGGDRILSINITLGLFAIF